ncbi:sodium-dependent phosphate transport protein 4 isoform X4 [Aotus nancymaae]|uniref:sodium-dependent phosphate transport protein 4 isoform X4 n=1 Tax=Aotus nancymaae TaxID=37293 RepID=UPI000626B9D2|nr:sodium-dependent phosphate transport protein 4 isoform X4 [Aotus nancymaae]
MATKTELGPIARERKYTQDKQVDEGLIPRKVPIVCSTRFGIALILHFCNFIMMAQNVIMSITMVAMVNSTSPQSQLNGSPEGLPVDSFGGLNKAPKSLPAKAPVYDWCPQIQGIIFGAASYGAILTMALGGYLAGRVGTKRVVGISLFANSFLTLCIPPAADFGIAFLIATRIAQGLCQGSMHGGQFAIWGKWGLPHEQNRLCSIALSGLLLGGFTAILISGFIIDTLGWPFVFYVFGGVGCVFCLTWFVVIYDDPVSHPWISASEKEYIISSLKQQNGLLSALPFIVAYITGVVGGYLADFLLTKNFRLITVRKLATILGSLPPSVLIVSLPYLSSSYITATAFLTLSCGLSTLCQSGIYVNALDIAPRHSSFLMGASRGFSGMAGVIVPTVSGILLSQDPEFGWRNVFFLLFAINMAGVIFYSIFGEADVQDWAKERKLTRL